MTDQPAWRLVDHFGTYVTCWPPTSFEDDRRGIGRQVDPALLESIKRRLVLEHD